MILMGILDGRVAIITGGGRGIGASISRLYAAQGAQLVINDLGGHTDGTGHDEGPARAIADELNANGTVAVADDGDISDTETGERLVQAAIDQFGKLDIVVNVAGILRDRMIFNLPAEDWDAVIRVHLRGHYSTVRPASAYWRSQRNPNGNYRIINFSSGSGLHGSPGQPNYAAAKLGIVGLTYSLAQGLARYGVTANAIAPGASTRLTDTIPDDKRVGASVGDSAAPDPKMSPDNVAPLCAYLASTESSWLTGRTLSASGYRVGLYNNPEVIAEVDSDGPWSLDDLAAKLTSTFKPLADGVPYSAFAAAQVATAGGQK
jgi:NAD(P)-dependent dehydrogenase (short-subunit alcohol dehydrogenase family)